MTKDQKLAIDKIKDKEARRKKLDNTLLEKSLSALNEKQNKIFEAAETERNEIMVQWGKSHNEECEQKNRNNRIRSSRGKETKKRDKTV